MIKLEALKTSKQDVVIVGGWLGGLVAALFLVAQGHPVTLIEKKVYPFHRVCGEYVSNEVLDFLKRHQLFPDFLDLPLMETFEFSDTQGKSARLPLDLVALASAGTYLTTGSTA